MNLIKKGKNFNQIAKIILTLTNLIQILLFEKSDLPLESADAVFGAKLNKY